MAICLSACLNSLSLSTLFLALPFAITAVGGNDKDLGLAMGFCYIGYILSCSMVSFILDKYNQKRLIQIGLSCITVFSGLVCAVVFLHSRNMLSVNSVTAMIAAVGMVGFCQSFIWPPIMGWVSSGFEGEQLTRRLGKYNFSWSISMTVWPFIAGFMLEASLLATMLTSVLSFIASVVVITIAKGSSVCKIECPSQSIQTPTLSEKSRTKGLLICARLGLFTSACIFILPRSQVAILMTQEYSYTESDFGILSAVFCFTLLVILTLTGRYCKWHNRFLPMILSAMLLGVGLVLILLSSLFAILLLAVICIGIGYAFLYAAHQYYGVSGGKKRTALMAIHEVTLSSGFVLGSIAGGYLSQTCGRLSPYRAGLGIACLYCIATLLVTAACTLKNAKKSH